MCDDVIRFVESHIFHHPAERAFALAHAGLGVIPELTKAFPDPIDLGAFFCAHCLAGRFGCVARATGSCLFQFTQFGIPFRLSYSRHQAVVRINLEVTALCQIGFVLRARSTRPLAQTLCFVSTLNQLVLHSNRQRQGALRVTCSMRSVPIARSRSEPGMR
jgi:hypothetical protein